MTSVAIGIDLGTTNSCVAAYKDNAPTALANGGGKFTTPSVVAYTDSGKLVGDAALRHRDRSNIVYEAKRLMGKSIEDAAVRDDMARWPFEVTTNGDDSEPKIRVRHRNETKLLAPQQVSAAVLEEMKKTAETALGVTVRDAVITVPAYFNDAQRRSTILAAEIAGLNVLKILTEPSAAAIAYGFERDFLFEKTILIYDFGGGTFDVSIMQVKEGDFTNISIDGDTHLGGADIDALLVEHFARVFKEHSGIDLADDVEAREKLRRRCVELKHDLTDSGTAEILLKNLVDGHDLDKTMSRNEFEELCAGIFTRTIDIVKASMERVKLKADDIAEIVLVGGSTRIPKVLQLLRDVFPDTPVKRSINPDQAVAIGAAIMAAKLAHNPEEGIRRLRIEEITPLTLGTDILFGRMSEIIPRNTRIPIEKTEIYFNVFDNQKQCHVGVCQGEKRMYADNIEIGEFDLDLQPMPAGENEIEVTFAINANGVFHATARDKALDKPMQIEINYYACRPSDEEIRRMIAEAEEERRLEEVERERDREMLRFEGEVRSTLRNIANYSSRKGTSAAAVRLICDAALNWIRENGEASIETVRERRATFAFDIE